MAPKRSAPEAAPQAVEEEAAFPRGGGSTLSALEAKTLRAEGAAQARAEAAAGGSRKKQKKNADPQVCIPVLQTIEKIGISCKLLLGS